MNSLEYIKRDASGSDECAEWISECRDAEA